MQRRGDDRRARAEAVWREHRGFVATLLTAYAPRGADLDDLLQEVALSLVAHVDEVRDPRRLRPWLRSVAIRAALTAGRRARAQRRRALPLDDEPADRTSASAARRDEARDEAERVLSAVQRLPAPYRETLLLRSVRGLGQREIAEALELPETTIETRLARARRLLREALGIEEAAGRARARIAPEERNP
jgi:RNA polymerase sigma factor (sigma-70 family)